MKAILALLLLLSSNLSANDGVAIQIVDKHGVAVPSVSVSNFWGFNGPLPVRGQAGSESDKQWVARYRRVINSQMGSPVPEGKYSVTDRNGRATISEAAQAAVIAYSQETSAGVLLLPAEESGREVALGKLTEVVIELELDNATAFPEWWYVQLNVPYNEAKPTAKRQVGICETFSKSLKLLLPVGDYEIAGYGCSEYQSGVVDLKSPAPLQISIDKNTPASVEYALRLTEDPKSRQLLQIESKENGRWTEHKELFGKLAPHWHATDVRGLAMDSKPSDFRGRWLLLYFWSPDCFPCVTKSIPDLMQFWDRHSDSRHRFAVVAVCYDFREELTSMRELDARLQHIKDKVWMGRSLPFPQVLDSTFKSIERYGLAEVGNYVLINPRGVVVEGGIDRLAEVLDREATTRVKRNRETGKTKTTP